MGIDNLPKAEQDEILAKVNRRLEEVVLRVFAQNLSESEVKKVAETLKKGEDIGEKIALISADIPLLAQKLEAAIGEEIERLKTVLKNK